MLNADLQSLLAVLPPVLRAALQGLPSHQLLEVIMDVGRLPQARFSERAVNLATDPVSPADLERVVALVGEFSADNRAGIEGTLHRIACLRNRRGEIIGLTLRVGRAVAGTIDFIQDLIERGDNLLLLGRPGVGKTTRLREIARVLADEFGKRVVIVDTSNEIGGDGDIPHPAIGSARRMQVSHPEQQHGVMIEAVENHMPEVIIVDEIGTTSEATAARTIAERGVQLIGTAHGNTLENLVMNPTLADLVGGVQAVTLGDDEARLRRTQKTIRERKALPTFDAVVEIVNREVMIVHPDTAGAVDKLLRGLGPGGIRRSPQGEEILSPKKSPLPESTKPVSIENQTGLIRIHPYALSRDTVERVIRDLRLEARTVKNPEQADFIIALRSRAEDARLRRLLQATRLPLYVVKKNTTAQIRRLLQNVLNILHGVPRDEVDTAVSEAEAAIKQVMEEGVTAALQPRSAAIRELQHRLAVRHHLLAESVGSEPQRHLIIHPV
ncbi:R3H domain-containing nucleic acid-binding protein [Nitrosococcus oceani]|uniref:Single-stranded nucleic acid binding R3H n=2 Tax=Nitrosococcus oceani TaxID=1229 RepID=Q3J6X9_NITOC|nr:R3H domain-containing nucleic acid-binding protein [Nitrosococcus oceani]ABA59417.1 Single-stranded nucleic acid binding R3H [Nitrosococcus oceani ATCC 19707]EDZ66618.1 R3H domain protein [Nitrosococcus oceani AFC27]KFI18159.1 single-stranded DNA-binding protein [Nitrosococcus oceani C-27]KFI21353.1 single-stranded DNA-binding protein [Nitrosococcus oceani]